MMKTTLRNEAAHYPYVPTHMLIYSASMLTYMILAAFLVFLPTL